MDRNPIKNADRKVLLTPAAFGRRLLVWLGVAAILGGVLLIRSGTIPKPATTAVATKPQVVLFAIVGTEQDTLGPGLIAFLSVITPNARDLIVLPVSGRTMTQAGESLTQFASTATPQQLAGEVARLAHAHINGYLMFDADFAEQVLTLLWENAQSWPVNLTPAQALQKLGWPQSRPNSKQLGILQEIIGTVPELSVGSQSLLAARVLETSQTNQTNFSPYQMFVLATFVRGERLVIQPLRKLPSALRESQVRR